MPPSGSPPKFAISPYYRTAGQFYESHRGPSPERIREGELARIRLIEVLIGGGILVVLVVLAFLLG